MSGGQGLGGMPWACQSGPAQCPLKCLMPYVLDACLPSPQPLGKHMCPNHSYPHFWLKKYVFWNFQELWKLAQHVSWGCYVFKDRRHMSLKTSAFLSCLLNLSMLSSSGGTTPCNVGADNGKGEGPIPPRLAGPKEEEGWPAGFRAWAHVWCMHAWSMLSFCPKCILARETDFFAWASV